MRREDFPENVQHALAEGDRWGVEQHGDELGPFAAMLAELQPKNVMEIGFRRGGTLAVWHELSRGKVIGVDLPDEFSKQRAGELGKAYARTFFVLSDSHLAATLQDVTYILQGEPLDLLFIDGDHSYEGVLRDWEMYAPLVRPGGIVAFHDIQANPACEVKALWEMLNQQREHREFNIGGPWGGIGVLYL